MRTYYRGHDASVTDEAFIWRTSPPKTFLVRELHHVVMVRGDLDPLRTTSAHVAGGALVLVAAGWPMVDTAEAFAAAILMVAVPAAFSGACWKMRPRQWELRATYLGNHVVLFCSADATAFGKVTRALQRALEASGPRTAGWELAGP